MARFESNCDSVTRLELFKTQHELARNFYDDIEFCPIPSFDEAMEHRQCIQRRISPQSSPSISPSRKHSTRAIPIIDPTNMTPVLVPSKSSSPPPVSAHHWPALPGSRSLHRAIPIVNPSTGQTRHHPFYYNVSVR